MFRIKRLYIFILETFLPLFLMTFFICLFIVLMQFLWKYIDELVGKGLSIDVIGELFFYAALTFVPLALPLSLLLASLMTFGNLGEHLELTAMKASGVSLVRIMRPLMVVVSLLAVGAFFFQNDVLPKSQVKMWTLLFSVRQKTPTLDIPEGAVYSQIPGYNLYVKHKDKATGVLRDVRIYDVGDGVGFPRVISADSGKLSLTKDSKHLFLQLYSGNWYEQLSQGTSANGSDLFRRESYHDKEILIPYDATFTRMDDQSMKSQYIGKNMKELQKTIDSVSAHVDSTGATLANELRTISVCGVPCVKTVSSKGHISYVPVSSVKTRSGTNDFDSIWKSLDVTTKLSVVSMAQNKAMSDRQDYEFKGFSLSEDNYTIRRHKIELQKKFTLSLACLIFFFIGAPLGAIVRKGGLGTPVVISVILFVIYYIIDNVGYKLAKDGRWDVWEGVWLSSFVLLPLGVFLTYKAVNDSAVLNPDAYFNFFRKLFGLHQVRKLEMKEVVIDEVNPAVAMGKIEALRSKCTAFLSKYDKNMGYMAYWNHGIDASEVRTLAKDVNDLVEYLSNSKSQLVINKAMDFPVIRQMLTYSPVQNRYLGMALAALLPVSVPFYLIGLHHQKVLKAEIASCVKFCDDLRGIFEVNK